MSSSHLSSLVARIARARATDPSALALSDGAARTMWVVVVALDLFWLSNPLVFFTFDASLRSACAVTLVACLLTPPRSSVLPPWTVMVVLVYGLASSVWSTYTTLTVKFVLVYVALAAVGVAVAAVAGVRTIAYGMILGGVLYVVASVYAFERGLPFAVAAFGQSFPAGVGTNRNIMAYTLVICLAVAIGVVPRTWRGRACWAAGVAIVVYGLYLSQSATGFVAPVVLAGAALALGWLDRPTRRPRQRRRALPWWSAVVAASTLAFAAYVLHVVLDLTGRDATTLSGRTPLWSATWAATQGWDRIIGAGWGTVWQHPWLEAGPNQLNTDIVRLNGGVFQPHGHNSFFDVLPELGLVGAGLVAGIYVQAVRRALRLRRAADATSAELGASRVVLLGVLALVVCGITEPMSTIPLGFAVVVMLAAVPRSGVAGDPDRRRHTASAHRDPMATSKD